MYPIRPLIRLVISAWSWTVFDRDRKSTRLNSSHLVTSYAAFCLKKESEWTRMSIDAQAPDKTTEVTIHLYIAHAPQGTLWWDAVSLDSIPAPAPRPVTLASIHLR